MSDEQPPNLGPLVLTLATLVAVIALCIGIRRRWRDDDRGPPPPPPPDPPKRPRPPGGGRKIYRGGVLPRDRITAPVALPAYMEN